MKNKSKSGALLSYSEKLRDPRWQERRRVILDRADFSCEECGAEDIALHVHHKAYRRGAEPWEYEDDELIALCEGCHADRHEIYAIVHEALGRWDYDFVRRNHLALLVLGFCAAGSKEAEVRCMAIADRISDYGSGSSFFICGFSAGKGYPRHDPEQNPARGFWAGLQGLGR